MRDPEQKPFCNRLFLKRLQEGISHEKQDLVYGARAAAVRLRGADCVRKSYPDFWEVYQSIGGECHVL